MLMLQITRVLVDSKDQEQTRRTDVFEERKRQSVSDQFLQVCSCKQRLIIADEDYTTGGRMSKNVIVQFAEYKPCSIHKMIRENV